MQMKFISKGNGALVELLFYLCIWIVEKERKGHSRQSKKKMTTGIDTNEHCVFP